ncbi:triokinase/FMN cyclase-like isoform X2 [Tubulanus polymorphus]|uniref:triokinase/FMN cyclase-like isoform X2 n=1 Tax=Tubulanus polymorphus TaxID=672921 RepID=UPI003DA5B74D
MTRNNMEKKIINNPNRCVSDSLEGYVAVNPGVQLVKGYQIIIRSDVDQLKEKVAVITGGGSGHEPCATGYVGPGMLTAAVAGAVFSSPGAHSILTAIRTVSQWCSGVLLLVANYTGDRLNFGCAAEQAKIEGYNVESVTVGEDCALENVSKTAGRRGLSGQIIMFKIMGAMSEAGKPLEEMVRVGSTICTRLGTIGMALTACCLPGGRPTFNVKDDEIELGLGAHGEPGVKPLKITNTKETVQVMLDHMLNLDNQSHFVVTKDKRVVMLVNNLGSMTQIEQYTIIKEAVNYLHKGINILRIYTGRIMTTLEMSGSSITLLNITDEILRYLDAPTSVPSWPKIFKTG